MITEGKKKTAKSRNFFFVRPITPEREDFSDTRSPETPLDFRFPIQRAHFYLNPTPV